MCEMLCYIKWQGLKLKTNKGRWLYFFFINLKEFIAVFLKVVRVSTLIRDSTVFFFKTLCISTTLAPPIGRNRPHMQHLIMCMHLARQVWLDSPSRLHGILLWHFLLPYFDIFFIFHFFPNKRGRDVKPSIVCADGQAEGHAWNKDIF